MPRRGSVLVMLVLASAAATACREAHPPPSPALPPAARSLGEFLGGGELRGFASRAEGTELLATRSGPDGWKLVALSILEPGQRRLPVEPELAGERLLAASPRGDVLVFSRTRPGAPDDGRPIARLGTGRLVELAAPGASATRFLGWTAGGGLLLESDETLAGRHDVVEVRLEDLSRAVRWVNDLGLRLGPLSADGRALAVAAIGPELGPRLGLVDLTSATLREIAVAEGLRGPLAPQAFSADGRSLVVLDRQDGPARAFRVRLGDGRAVPMPLACADPVALRLSPTGRWAAIDCRESGLRRLVLGDPTHGGRLDPPLPRAYTPRAVAFSADDRTLVLEAAGPTRGSDLFLWQPDAGTDRQLTYLLDPRLEAEDLVAPSPLESGPPEPPILAAERFPPARGRDTRSPAVLLLEDVARDEPLDTPTPYHPLVQYLANQGHPVIRAGWGSPQPPTVPSSEERPASPSASGPVDPVLASLARRLGPGPEGTVLVGVGRRAARLALELSRRGGARWAGVAAVLPGMDAPTLPSPDAAASRGAAAGRLPPDWIEALPDPTSPATPTLIVACDADPALPPVHRERLLARLTAIDSPPRLELLAGDADCLERPGPRASGWAAVARFARAPAPQSR